MWFGLALAGGLPWCADAPAAQWTTWELCEGGNGHEYRVVHVPEGIDWHDAHGAALDTGGHLATIGSAAEDGFVFGLVQDVLGEALKGAFGPWLGAFQALGDQDPTAPWVWVTGEPFAFTAWSPDEPNGGVGENHLHFKGVDVAGWNDLPGSTLLRGYVVEREPSNTPVLLGAATWDDCAGAGHLYELYRAPTGITWFEADAFATGLGGHLASIRSVDENQFISNLVQAHPGATCGANLGVGPWIGARQPAGSPEPAQGFLWGTCEPFGYTNWNAGEPNDSGGDEEHVHLDGTGPGGMVWNDKTGADRLQAFLVEYGPRLCADSPTVGLFAGGSAGFSLEAGPAHAGQLYLVLGSFAGTCPGFGFLAPLTVPLVPDGYTSYAALAPNQCPLVDTFGLLDGAGSGSAALALPPGSPLGLLGLTVHHAFLVLDPLATPPWTAVSTPVSTAFVP